MRITLIADAEESAAAAIADELRRQVLARGPIAAVYAAPGTEALAALLTKELSIAAAKPLEGLSSAEGGDALTALRHLQPAAWSAIERFKEDHGADDQVVVVAPVMAVRAVVCRALSMPVEDFERFRLDPGSLTTIEFRLQQNRTIVASLNETCHLATVEVS